MKKYNIRTGNTKLGCDGEEAYKIATRAHFKPSTKVVHFELVSILHHLINSSHIHWTFRHVRGHQDKHTSFQNLDLWSRLNVIADANAKVALWEKVVTDQSTPILSPPSNTIPPVTLEVGSKHFTICSKLFKNLKQCISRQNALDYWKTKHVPIDNENSDIDAFKHASRNTPNGQQRWLAKWFSGICGVGRMLKCWKDQPHSKFPICLMDNETVSHVIHCKHSDAS